MTSYVNTAVRNDANYARSFTDLRKVATASKYVKMAGTSLGVVGGVATLVESSLDGKLSLGDAYKLGIAAASIAFPVFGVLYALTDTIVLFSTGTSLTDRIANGIDSAAPDAYLNLGIK
jgi:hypothetical protein